MALRDHGVVRAPAGQPPPAPNPRGSGRGRRAAGRGRGGAAASPVPRPRYLKQISELTFSEEGQLKKLNQLKSYNLQQEMRSLRSARGSPGVTGGGLSSVPWRWRGTGEG